MALRLTLLRTRRRLRAYRLLFGVAAAVLSAVLNAVFDDIPEGLRVAALLGVGILAGMTVLLIDVPGERSGQDDRLSQPAGPGPPPTSDSRASRIANRFHWRWTWRRRTVPVLPASDGLFRGRRRELDDLVRWHRGQREERNGRLGNGLVSTARSSGAARRTVGRRGTERRQYAGPILILVHGRAGIGKTAFAEELARRLASEYRDGQVFANLGTGGAARRPAEVLQDLLVALGWQENEMPGELDKRAKVFRALTANKRMLFIFDAARDANQLYHLLPSDPRCAVVVTSRRDLSGNVEPHSRPHELGAPDLADSLEILYAVSQVSQGSRQPDAVRIVQLCGALPLALRSAGERVSQDGTDICHVARLLEPADTRLGWLDRPGRPVTSVIDTQYVRALPAERRALTYLALVPSTTFFPWVLRPLLDVPFAEAEALVTRLAAAQLLEEVESEESGVLPRYRFHPLDRLYVEWKLARLPRRDREAAQRGLEEAYYEFVTLVLARRHQRLAAPAAPRWIPADSDLPDRIAERPEPWVRAEYPNLLAVIAEASRRGDHFICWRVGVWLGGCVPENPDIAASLAAYRSALDSAHHDGADIGLIDVLLAQGSFHTAVENYTAAEESFQQAIARAQTAQQRSPHQAAAQAGTPVQSGTPDQAARREARAHRKRGEAYLQAASYHRACRAFEEALRISARIGDETEGRLARLLIAEARHADLIDSAYDELLEDAEMPDAVRVRVLLALAEVERRRGDWRTARENLDRAARLNVGDERGLATMHYRLGRLHLHHQRTAVRDGRADVDHAQLGSSAVRHATEALLAFERMGNGAGLVRARCLLARALLITDRMVEAEQVISAAESGLASLADMPGYAVAPLRARVLRARGELLLASREPEVARARLTEAARLFGEQDDWAAQSEILFLIDRLRTRRIGGFADGGEVLPSGLSSP